MSRLLGRGTTIRSALPSSRKGIPSDSLWESPQEIGLADRSDAVCRVPQEASSGSRDMKIGRINESFRTYFRTKGYGHKK
jgi:hypothetical protein